MGEPEKKINSNVQTEQNLLTATGTPTAIKGHNMRSFIWTTLRNTTRISAPFCDTSFDFNQCIIIIAHNIIF